jgi:hypothetical protein
MTSLSEAAARPIAVDDVKAITAERVGAALKRDFRG